MLHLLLHRSIRYGCSTVVEKSAADDSIRTYELLVDIAVSAIFFAKNDTKQVATPTTLLRFNANSSTKDTVELTLIFIDHRRQRILK